MAPEAAHDEVKRSYLELALRFRPDQMTESSEEERERARFRRDEVNEAWAVLRNPSARAHYDDRLRQEEAEKDLKEARRRSGRRGATGLAPEQTIVAKRESPAVPATATSLTAAASAPKPAERFFNPFDQGDGDAAELDPADSDEPEPGPRRIQWAPLIIGGVVLTVVLVLSGIASHKADPGLKIETVEGFGVGTCVVHVTDAAIGTQVLGGPATELVVTVPCTDPNEGRVVARMDFPLPCPRGRALLLAGSKQSVCLDVTGSPTVTTRPSR